MSVWLEPEDVVRITGGATYPAVQRRRLQAKRIPFIEDGSPARRPLVLRAYIDKLGGVQALAAAALPVEPDFSVFPKVA